MGIKYEEVSHLSGGIDGYRALADMDRRLDIRQMVQEPDSTTRTVNAKPSFPGPMEVL